MTRVKPILSGHARDTFVERWSLNTGQNILRRLLWEITEWPLIQVVSEYRWPLTQVSLYITYLCSFLPGLR